MQENCLIIMRLSSEFEETSCHKSDKANPPVVSMTFFTRKLLEKEKSTAFCLKKFFSDDCADCNACRSHVYSKFDSWPKKSNDPRRWNTPAEFMRAFRNKFGYLSTKYDNECEKPGSLDYWNAFRDYQQKANRK